MAEYSDNGSNSDGGNSGSGKKVSSYSGYSQQYRREKFAYTQARSHGTPF